MARRRPEHLVLQHLENLSRSALEQYQGTIKQYVRRRHGIYALYRKNKLYYVGLASNLRSRLKHHLKDRHAGSWDRFSVYLTANVDHLRVLEALVLRITQPKGNKVKGKIGRSQDLAKQLWRDIRAHHREIEEGIFKSTPKEKKRERRATSDQKKLAKFMPAVRRLRVSYKGKTYKAKVLRDGRIRFRGKIYNSPSTAGSAIVKRTCNGWDFWKYEQAPGHWVKLNNLKR